MSPSKKIDETASVHDQIRKAYASVADVSNEAAATVAHAIGYSSDVVDEIGDANLGLGCGNPILEAALKPGDAVLDLGSGAGFDALIARSLVGEDGHVIGVDMTREMLSRARDHASKRGVSANVEFREGMIEALPVLDDSIDVAISNCVVNLSPNKDKVFRETHRVLKPGGKLVFSDILLSEPLADDVVKSAAALVGCIAGAALIDEYERGLRAAGFVDIKLARKASGANFALYADPIALALKNAIDPDVLAVALTKVGSYAIEATKPADA